MKLRRFQQKFLKSALQLGIDTACLCLPRGNGKTWLAAHILGRCLTPGDALFVRGSEYLLCAASIEQARLCFRFIRAALEPTGEYRFLDSLNRIGITHVRTNTRLRVLSSNGKTAMGIVGCPLLVADEPGSWETVGGQLMQDAIQTAQGKPGSPLKVIYIGTLAPAQSGWWHDLIKEGTHGSTHVTALQGDRDRWDQWQEIRRVNPLVSISPEFRKKLLEERDAARRDTRLKARFLSYRLNLPSADETELLLTDEDWETMCRRDAPPRDGPAILGLDMGYNRAWSAGVTVYQNGRMEAVAVAPGVPSLEDQEKRDRVPAGIYRRLEDAGLVIVAEGTAVPTAAQVWAAVVGTLGRPVRVVADRFRMPELAPVVEGAILEPRVARWSEATFDIRALRRGFIDGPLVMAPESRPLVAASIAVARVKNDDQGSTRITKSSNNTARDDVAQALTLAAGAYQRASELPTAGPSHVVV